jgi:hypothetical protein
MMPLQQVIIVTARTSWAAKVMQRTYQSCVEGILSTNGTEPFHLFGSGTALSELLKIYDFSKNIQNYMLHSKFL